ncbi:MAG: RNA polymerase sigma factor, partial [Solirubrobacteraceae bacterium]
PWVKAIARREALRIAARRGPDERASENGQDMDENDELLRVIDRLDVARGLAGLSPIEQEALLLHYWAGKSDTEIASMLGTPVGTIKVRLHRARRKLGPGLMSR